MGTLAALSTEIGSGRLVPSACGSAGSGCSVDGSASSPPPHPVKSKTARATAARTVLTPRSWKNPKRFGGHQPGTLGPWPEAGPDSSGFGTTSGCATTPRCGRRSSARARDPVFCFDDRLLHGRHASGPRTQFLLECLAELDAGLRERGSGLSSATASPRRRSRLAKVAGAGASISPAMSARSLAGAASSARRSGTPGSSRRPPGLNAVDEVRDIRTQQGKPYTVFSPFHRTGSAPAPRRASGAARASPAAVEAAKGRLPTLEALGLTRRWRSQPTAARRRRKRSSASSRTGARVHREPRRAGERPDLAALPLPPLRLHHPAPARGAPAARQGGRGLSPPALLARLPPPRARLPPAQREVGVPGPLPGQDQVELRAEGVRAHGARDGRATRWSTPGCASSAARAGCTTARAWSSARS